MTGPLNSGPPRTGWGTPGFAERFWARVDRSAGPDACWPWTGPKNAQGYGIVSGGTASRMALELTLGRRLAVRYELACHHCDNPPCCNPAHLFAGSHRDNAQDALRKGHVSHLGAPNDVFAKLRRAKREAA